MEVSTATKRAVPKSAQREEHMNQLFDSLENMFGKLDPSIRKRLQAVIDNPTEKTWDNAYSIIVNWSSRNHTLWQSVIAIDPTFPLTGPRENQHGKRIEGWARIPDRDLILKALLLACKEGSGQ
jgi:hypothetical protein